MRLELQRTRSPRARQAGAAIITVMLVVAIVTLVVSALFWRSHVTVRSVENRMALGQAQCIQRVVIDWAKVALQSDRRLGEVDSLDELWAIPVPRTLVDSTMLGGTTVGDKDDAVEIWGGTQDAQGRLNLTNLANDPGGKWLDVFKRLLEQNGQSPTLATALSERLKLSTSQVVDGKPKPAQVGYYPFLRNTDLLRVPGFNQSVLSAIDRLVVFLPNATPVNINTASGEVLAAVIKDLDVVKARGIASQPTPRKFPNLGAAKTALRLQDDLPPEMLSVGSSFFLVSGVIRYRRVEAQTLTLIQRQSSKVEVIWQYRS